MKNRDFFVKAFYFFSAFRLLTSDGRENACPGIVHFDLLRLVTVNNRTGTTDAAASPGDDEIKFLTVSSYNR